MPFLLPNFHQICAVQQKNVLESLGKVVSYKVILMYQSLTRRELLE